MMHPRFAPILMVIALLLAGCATVHQDSVVLSPTSIDAQPGKIGVIMGPLPKPDTLFPGADCLLCIATASAANAALTAHVKTLSYEDLPNLKQEVAELLRKRGTDARVIDEEFKLDSLGDYGVKGINVAPKDFSLFQKKYGIDKLLVININSLGFIRTYSAYFPTSEPKGSLQGLGYLVNLNNNRYEWYQFIGTTKSASGNWDEPPKFPGLTNAYYQTLEMGKDSFLKPFARLANTPVSSSLGVTTSQSIAQTGAQ